MQSSVAFAAFPSPYAGVDSLDLPKYSGGWYEILTTRRVNNTIERGCECPQTYYSLSLNSSDPKSFDITNACIRFGRYWQVTGHASPVSEQQYPSQYNVQLNNTAYSNYNDNSSNSENYNYVILKFWRSDSGDYEHALVGGNRSNMFWLISRNPTIDDRGIVDDAIETAKCNGYNTNSIVYRDQSKCAFIIPQQS